MSHIIYTDGSCIVSKRDGGWAFLSFEEKYTYHVSGGEKDTTNNRMELTAVIKALDFSNQYTDYIIYSDSKYVINCATGKYKRKMNKDLWEEYNIASNGKNIEYIWVKGHSGNKYNEIVDKLAQMESQSISTYS